MEMLNTLQRAWKVADIRKKMIFTLLMLLVFRVGSNSPKRPALLELNIALSIALLMPGTGTFDPSLKITRIINVKRSFLRISGIFQACLNVWIIPIR